MSGRRSIGSGAPDRDGHAARQWAYFKDADEAKFRWQTGDSVFAASERRLVSAAAGSGSLLEVGCGEGGNLFHLGPGGGLTVGMDFSSAKAAFAAVAIPWGRLVCGDAARLPFRSRVFDRVLCRDLLHHLRPSKQRGAVEEMLRVCRPGGEVVVIEPNGLNPLIGAFACLVPAERGMLGFTPGRVAALLEGLADRIRIEMAQPLPVTRLLLHYRFGAPGLGRLSLVRHLLSAMDAALGRVVPRGLWAYIIIRGRLPA